MREINPSRHLSTDDEVFNKFRKYSEFYESSIKMGAAKILISELNLPPQISVPLSLSHGVDFGHCYQPLDAHLIEPAHWSYNDNIHLSVSKLKHSICLPHPWILLCKDKEIKKGERALIISPPPGEENDRLLLDKIKLEYDLQNVDILLKHRGEIAGSINFFQKHGVGIVSAGEGDEEFYNRLLNLLSSYERIIACNFSSAVIFASALGKPIDFIDDYSYEYYDVENIYEFVNYGSKLAREFIINFTSAPDRARTNLSRRILGSDFLEESSVMRKKYISALSSIDFPLHYKNDFPAVRKFIMNLGIESSRRGIVRLGSGLNQFSRSQKKIMKIRVNELSVWKNGPSEANLNFSLEKFVPGVTIPATAVSKYENPLN